MFLLLRVGIVLDASSMRERIYGIDVGRGVGNGLWRLGILLSYMSARQLASSWSRGAYLEGNTSGNVSSAVVESSLMVSLYPESGIGSSRMEDVINC